MQGYAGIYLEARTIVLSEISLFIWMEMNYNKTSLVLLMLGV